MNTILHTQSSTAALPRGALEFVGHAKHVLAPSVDDTLPVLQVPVNPLLTTEPSDVNVTLRNPVTELYTLDELRDPDCLKICSGEEHEASLHLNTETKS